MKLRDAQRLFSMPKWKGTVEDYSASRFDAKFSSKRHAKDLLWNFGFKVKDGDVVCAILLRPRAAR